MIAQSVAPTTLNRMSGSFAAAMSAGFKRFCYQRTISALSQLSDIQLKNAGIARRDIATLAARSVYGV